jgi:hypothetical protein
MRRRLLSTGLGLLAVMWAGMAFTCGGVPAGPTTSAANQSLPAGVYRYEVVTYKGNDGKTTTGSVSGSIEFRGDGTYENRLQLQTLINDKGSYSVSGDSLRLVPNNGIDETTWQFYYDAEKRKLSLIDEELTYLLSKE